MKKPRCLLIIDTSFLAWRSFYTMGDLSYGDLPTGVLFGFLRDLRNLMELHRPTRTVFCFDYGRGIREKRNSLYKQNRREAYEQKTDEEKRTIHEMRQQVELLRTELLEDIGFRNVLFEKGYESDDIIASVCHNNLRREDSAIIISEDSDLYQLLTPQVSIWSVRKGRMYTQEEFVEEYKINAFQWSDVKALAGCHTDNVKGIKGIGIKTAVKFLSGKLPNTHKTFKAIIDGNKTWEKNLEYVRLPLKGTPVFRLRKDLVTEEGWKQVARRFGMRHIPGVGRAKGVKHHGKGFEIRT